jgi:hypothetical protein
MFRRQLRIAIFGGILVLAASAASAQATRTWVSGVGDDANPCSRTAPCKTFAGAISKTATGGIISVLDPGGFGSVTITKSITIDGTAQDASVLATGVTGINIAGGTGAFTVVLRNLDINGAPGTGTSGGVVVSTNVVGVHIENCRISGFPGRGIDFRPTNGGTGPAAEPQAVLYVSNTEIVGVGAVGLYVSGGKAVVDHTRFAGNFIGVKAVNAGMVSIRDSSVGGSAGAGLVADTDGLVEIADSTVAMNAVALKTFATGTIASTNVSYIANVGGLAVNGGIVASGGGNRLVGNGPGSFTNSVVIQ